MLARDFPVQAVDAEHGAGDGTMPATEAPAAAASEAHASRSTHFLFENKVFSVPGAFFSFAHDSNEAVYNVQLGDVWGKIAFRTLREAFGIDDNSADAVLLGVVERSLKYVKTIRPGDSIPRELLDGTASWRVEDSHLQIARGRITVQLVSWITGKETLVTDRGQLEQVVEDPQTKQRAQQAFSELARRFGIPEERKQEIVDKVESIARELSYIEALRDRYHKVQQIITSMGQAGRIYKTDRQLQSDLSRMMALVKQPILDFEDIFGQLDAQTGEIMAVLKSYDSQVSFIRRMRDELHTRLMLWDDVIYAWDGEPVERGPELEARLKKTYHFLAQHFLVTKVWQRGA
ncbi:hypothetical protein [Nitrospirillum sp. BR 11828]|uniref:hypothetical protein n=1 Tax=Nitrospirillum sp. BR 11828 TaxID=3104325 RepID=UPI002ACA5C8D|nr:hypothetical protein [Nitrospirillum sp. BR 11828]MDZ5647386.1 hypothetical protein [Nitrospirillum sp. BR 11828]